MRKFIAVLILGCILLVGGGGDVAFAGKGYFKSYLSNGGSLDRENWEQRVAADFPHLVKLMKDVYLGAEIQKDLVRTSASEGWAAIGKVTVTSTLVDFTK